MQPIRTLLAILGLGVVSTLPIAPASAGQDCECIGNGKRIKEGGVICLQIGSSQRYLARCERNLNNTSWKKISDNCPVSQVSPVLMTIADLPKG